MKDTKNKKLVEQECADCGEVISIERLRLVPKTETCIECQEHREKRGNFQRHRMVVTYNVRCEEIESVDETLVRADE